jgi:hypothetical protein
MSVAFKVASSGRRQMGTHPTSSTSPAKLKPIIYIAGMWPFYQTTLYCLVKGEQRIQHFGKRALTAYLVERRMEEEHVIKDERKLWK